LTLPTRRLTEQHIIFFGDVVTVMKLRTRLRAGERTDAVWAQRQRGVRPAAPLPPIAPRNTIGRKGACPSCESSPQVTLCWREMDSNCRSPVAKGGVISILAKDRRKVYGNDERHPDMVSGAGPGSFLPLVIPSQPPQVPPIPDFKCP
jgi:hypothetical protein